ncbi:hypothetical protein ACFQ7N_40500 [Streptomyces niveus]|uniref:hypothetical protein n=1 Tax=Streptomyces niveus TaxID=193462 RepID=UPI0036A23373
MIRPARHDPATVYTITTATQSGPPPVPYAAAPPPSPEAPLPGVELVTLPGGEQQWAYVGPRGRLVAPGPVPQPVPAWAKTAALLMFAASGSAVLAGFALSLAGPWLQVLAYALMAFAVAVAVVAFVVRGIATRSGRRGSGGSTTARASATATGRTVLGGKVTATATATATNK